MEDSPMYDPITIASRVIGSYTVFFTDDINKSFEEKSRDPSAVFLIDKKLTTFYTEEINIIKAKSRFLFLEINEDNKSIDYTKFIINGLLKLNVRKNDTLVAIGGGITQDLVAFVSSILFRGMNWEFYPTTLLAQCDSCIGSKSSINFSSCKNLLGTFLPPNKIIIYYGFLDSLEPTEIKSGIGEMCHYFLGEKSTTIFDLFGEYNQLFQNKKKLSPFIKKSLMIKKAMIEIDEFDENKRHIFNYGHTFGHAIEAITSYKIPHGQAVTVGINIANYISMKMNFIKQEEFLKIYDTLKINMPLFKLTISNIDDYMDALSKDKKNKKNLLGCILKNKAGTLEKHFLKLDKVLKGWLIEYSTKY